MADLTLANANVFYELGIRHAAKPFTTVSILANVSADQLLSLALNTFWHFIEDIGRLMHPAPLLGYWTIFFLQGDPESKRTVANGYTEVVMATAALLGFELAPRIRDLHDQTLYSSLLCPW